ncbi:retron system putative HNH endonuclease [Alishewanella tabrizica]|uniref:TIGR02646 family protein n=1 Tax=Alishewanella tabrizica TaxID=671278 RepID=A0ABQ2WJY1_9ALTE|nr:retron system putative HNH endonuclease [Alishewanella tabrizica]GGW57108.1 hypothetical protein GCM10008111_11460 [Alishewanella tabrizica]
MLQIHKQAEPEEVIAWKALENEDWQPSYANLAGAPRKALRKALVLEQGGVCCYCNRAIAGPLNAIEEGEFHIEHLQPQSIFPSLELSYQNLHASCFKSESVKGPKHCGPAKGNWFDGHLLLSPMQDLTERFKYLDDGTIEAMDNDEPARVMIVKLKLDSEKLNEARFDELVGVMTPEFIKTATRAEFEKVYRACFTRTNGLYKPFAVAIAQNLKTFLDRFP